MVLALKYYFLPFLQFSLFFLFHIYSFFTLLSSKYLTKIKIGSTDIYTDEFPASIHLQFQSTCIDRNSYVLS